MAQKVETFNVDDLNPEIQEDVETVYFGLDGDYFEIDLGEANRTRLREELKTYVEKARKTQNGRMKLSKNKKNVKRQGQKAKSGNTADEREKNKLIRDRAAAAGVVVPTAGRLSDEIKERFG